MRKSAAGVLAVVMLTSAAPPSPLFEYKGFRAGDVIPEERLARCRAEPVGNKPSMADAIDQLRKAAQGEGLVSCVTRDPVIAGRPAISEVVNIHDGRLSSVRLRFSPENFPTVRDAFTSKYGQPCKLAVKTLGNAYGGKLDSPSYTWCFASGELVADLFYGDRNTSSAEYRDINQAGTPEPKVDF